jgi:VCBS repeat-containing protein
VTAEAGIDTVTIGGVDVTDASTTPVTIPGTEGTLVVTGYDATTGVITYEYTEDGAAEDHSLGDDSVVDQFAVVVTDIAGVSSNDTLDIQIIDTAPVAQDDANAITEDSTSVTGNVLTSAGASAGDVADIQNVDTPITVTAQTITGSYGTLTLNSDGTYTYALDNTNGDVQALNDGQSLTETFNYTISDSDGDSSNADLVITINGVTDTPLRSAVPLRYFAQSVSGAEYPKTTPRRSAWRYRIRSIRYLPCSICVPDESGF